MSTLFIQHHVLENMVSLYLHELSEKEEILDGYEVYTQLFCDIVNIGLHFFHKDVRLYAASCSEV